MKYVKLYEGYFDEIKKATDDYKLILNKLKSRLLADINYCMSSLIEDYGFTLNKDYQDKLGDDIDNIYYEILDEDEEDWDLVEFNAEFLKELRKVDKRLSEHGLRIYFKVSDPNKYGRMVDNDTEFDIRFEDTYWTITSNDVNIYELLV